MVLPTEQGKQPVMPWAQAMNDLLSWQGRLFDAQCKVGQTMLESVLNSSSRVLAGPPAVQPSATKPSPANPAPAKREPAEGQPAKAAAKPVDAAPRLEVKDNVNIKDKVALITGAGGGIGEAVVHQLAQRGARAVVMVDMSDRIIELSERFNREFGRTVALPRIGDTTSDAFRKEVYDEITAQHGPVSICVPAAGITRDRLSVKIDKATGKADIYPIDNFRLVQEVNLVAPVYWALEMVARVAEDRWRRGKTRWDPEEGVQGTVVFIGSVSSQGNKGQISYAATKAGLEGAAATLMKEAIFHGVRCGLIHPGFTDTPMVQAMGQEYIAKYILPYTQLRRLIRPDEIADAICFMISNAAVSGELWADAGWHPSA